MIEKQAREEARSRFGARGDVRQKGDRFEVGMTFRSKQRRGFRTVERFVVLGAGPTWADAFGAAEDRAREYLARDPKAVPF